MYPLRVRDVEVLNEYRLRLTLTDGSVVERDISDLLAGPVFEPLRKSRAAFDQVRVEVGKVVWPNGADIDPDTLIWDGPPPNDPSTRPKPAMRVSVPIA